MSSSPGWGAQKTLIPENGWVLLNESRTVLRFSERLKEVSQELTLELLQKMIQACVPFSFTEELREIYFTILQSTEGRAFHGDYRENQGKIRLSCGNNIYFVALEKILVHELGHHLDVLECISSRQRLIKEYASGGANHMEDQHAQTDIREYIAIGFEIYYFGTREERGRLRRLNPKLYNVVNYLHKKHYKQQKNTRNKTTTTAKR